MASEASDLEQKSTEEDTSLFSEKVRAHCINFSSSFCVSDVA